MSGRGRGRGKDIRKHLEDKLLREQERIARQAQDTAKSLPSPSREIASDAPSSPCSDVGTTTAGPSRIISGPHLGSGNLKSSSPDSEASGLKDKAQVGVADVHTSSRTSQVSRPIPLICGPLRPQEDVAVSTSLLVPKVSKEEDLVTQIRKLNAGRGRGRPRQVFAISSDESEEQFRARRLGLPRSSPGIGTSTPLPSASPSVYSSNSEDDSDNLSESKREPIVRRGESGTSVPLAANYVWVTVEQNKGIFQYHVNFDPPLENLKTKRSILKEHSSVLGEIRNFDGAKLFLPFKLQNKVTELESFNPNEPTMKIKLIIKYIDSKTNKSYMRDYIQFSNILFRRIMATLGLINVNRQFFNIEMDAIHQLPNHKLEIWPGYVTAIDEREGGLMLCCDVTFRVLRTGTMLDILRQIEFLAYHDPNVNVRERFLDYVLRKIVLTRYNNRHYRIDDVDWEQTPQSKFEYRGEMISFVEYYQIQHSIRIDDLDQPLLCYLPRPKKNDPRQVPPNPILLIPELCYMTGLNEEITSQHEIMKDISIHTRLTPEQRSKALQTFINNVNQNPIAVKILKDWGLKIENGVSILEGRIVGEDLVLQLNPNYEFLLKDKNYEFGSEAKRVSCYEPIVVSNWALFCSPRDRDQAEKLSRKYLDVCRSIGISATPGIIQVINGKRMDDYRRCITEFLQCYPNLQFFIIVMARRQDDLYGLIKRLSCIDKPIPSQVILTKTLNDPRRLNSVISKIALQINCKLGGGLWTIRMPRVEKIMFVGVDVWHDPKQKRPSVTALVASLNDIHTKYFSKVVQQPVHQETMASLRPLFFEALTEFCKVNNGWPDRVLFFRDGIGDGELETTKQVEVVQLTETLSNRCENKPKFTFTVVQKRIHTRIFAQSTNHGRYINPTPGTVLDHTITRRFYFDFFLVSQLFHEGTVTPTHFIVLADNSDISPNLIQKFAFATSFMYYNWAGSIRVPAVCQYAHKLAFLVGQHLGMDPSEKLCKQLYYL